MTISTLSPEEQEKQLDEQAQKLFLEYLDKCRKLYGTVYKTEPEIDSEVSLQAHFMLEEFDKYRTARK